MVEMYHAQEQWDNRTAPKIHEAFSQIWDQEELRVSRDRVSINPPALDKDAAKESQVAFGLHFDTGWGQQTVAEAKKLRPIPKGVQGVLYLVDTPEENGAFICVPGMHNIVDEWLDTLPEDVTPNSQLQIKGEGQAQEVLLGGKTKRVTAEAGDLVICKPPEDFEEPSSQRLSLFACRATDPFCALRGHAAAALRGLQHRRRAEGCAVRSTPLKNGGDHSCCSRFGPLRNQPLSFGDACWIPG